MSNGHTTAGNQRQRTTRDERLGYSRKIRGTMIAVIAWAAHWIALEATGFTAELGADPKRYDLQSTTGIGTPNSSQPLGVGAAAAAAPWLRQKLARCHLSQRSLLAENDALRRTVARLKRTHAKRRKGAAQWMEQGDLDETRKRNGSAGSNLGPHASESCTCRTARTLAPVSG